MFLAAAVAFAVPAGADTPAEVRVGSRVIFMIPAPVGSITPSERAGIVNNKLEAILRDPSADPRLIDIELDREGTPVIRLGERNLLGVTQDDAAAYGASQEELADRWARQLRLSLHQLKPLYATSQEKIPAKFLSEHRVFLLLVQVGVLLLTAHLCGEGMRKLNQPPVLGHLLAGILLGPSFLGWLAPSATALLFPESQTQSYLLEVVSWLGVILLLGLTGLEIDTELIRRQGKPAAWASFLGLTFTFLSGLVLGLLVPDFVLANPEGRMVFSLFLATALSISSVPVVAKILMDMKLMRGKVGQRIMAAVIIDDTVGWMLMALIASMIATGSFEPLILLRTAAGAALYVLILFGLLRKPLFAGLRWVSQTFPAEEVMIAVLIAIILFNAAVTQLIGVHAVLGAFLAGVLLRQWPHAVELMEERIQGLTLALFAPIFFAAAGIHVDLHVLAEPVLLQLTLIATGVACFGKIVGCYFGGRIGGLAPWEAISQGIGMNARGAMGLIIAVLGFSLGVLTVSMFSVIVIMALATTVITPPLLKWSLRHVKMETADDVSSTRSDRGEIQRVLLATRGGQGAQAAEKLLAPLDVQVTVATVEDGDPAVRIAERAKEDFDLIVMGARDTQTGVFGSVVDDVIQNAPCPVLVLVAKGKLENPQRIVAATSGTPQSARATELALSLAKANNAHFDAVQVLEVPRESIFWSSDRMERARQAGQEILDELELQARLAGVPVESHLLESESAGPAIAEFVEKTQANLLVLSVQKRSSSTLFLGPTLSYLLSHGDCPLAILVV